MREARVTQSSGLYYRVEFRVDDAIKSVVLCHENKLAIYLSNWIQAGRVSDRFEIG